MKVYNYEGKEKEEIEKKIFEELKRSREEIIILERENVSGLFKKKKYNYRVLIIEDVIKELKEKLTEILKLMNIKFNLEINKKEKGINFLIFSDNNSILIGKKGRTILSLQTILKQFIYIRTGIYINLTLDVGNYKKDLIENIEKITKRAARDVAETKISIKLDNMNSYERRVVHTLLSNHKDVYTISEGEEPNRYVVINPR